MIEFENPKGATPLEEEELEGLKIKTITTRGELDRWEQENIANAMAWLETRKNKKNILEEEFIRKVHVKMLEKVWKWAGIFRNTNKNIGVDKYQIGVRLHELLKDVQYWIDNTTYKPDEIAARFHHRLVAIHCFPNGNGRHSRLLADTLLKDIFELRPFTWGNGDLTTAGDVRTKYINALKEADGHNYVPLIEFVRS